MLSRTASGIRNTDLFYRKEYLVIVEGDDDRPFWKLFFPENIDGYKLKLKAVGGKAEVKKYIQQILDSDAHFAVALDSDYSLFMNCSIEHSRIVETKTHSIENVFLCTLSITHIIQNLSKDTDYESEYVEKWMQHYDEKIYPLMVIDYIIERDKIGIKCMGDKCQPFFINDKTFELNDSKITELINSFNISFQEIISIQESLNSYKPRLHSRGHFFFSAVQRFISCEVKRLSGKTVSVSVESLFSNAIASCQHCFKENNLLEELQNNSNISAQEVVKLLKG
ncbi:DUF4435 domain-containing protein [Nostoc sp. NMS7]|uniref:DUF4435 domain-containing protein n=1 Tax=Nostoc sp. NMS7 TaxID=2815391 RepID=UPI0025EAD6D4|nr:DUF4435 domain-containing protein [Nostoc sp. NMS7]